jgi:kynurenine formamidase
MVDEQETPSNWGRWSPDDEVGTLNLITPECVREATRLVTHGEVLSLARVIRHDMVRTAERTPPTIVLTTDGGDYAAGAAATGGVAFADDFMAMPVATGTHIDSLAHAWSPEGLYNGHDPNTVRSRGARYCGIDKVSGLVTGGVLADICRLHGTDALPPSHVVTVAELEAATEGLGNPVGSGDALLVRTGWLTPANLEGRDLATIEREEPGLGIEAARWIAERDVAVVGADNIGVEVFPSQDPQLRAPLHVALINRLGVYMIELLDLEELAGRRPGRFLFIAAPLRLRGAVNSPLNPLAVL